MEQRAPGAQPTRATPGVTAPLLRVAPGSQNGAATAANRERTAPARTSSSRLEATLRLLAAFRAVRRDQLEAFLFAGAPLTPPSRRVAAFRILGELRERGFVEAVVLPGTVATAGATRAYVLTTAGQRAYATDDSAYPRRVRRPTIVLLDHAVALADIALAFRDGAAQAGDIALSWQADWEIVHELGCTTVIPDAFVTLERDGWRTRAFIEADRATEREHAFANKVRRYVDLYRDDGWRSVWGPGRSSSPSRHPMSAHVRCVAWHSVSPRPRAERGSGSRSASPRWMSSDAAVRSRRSRTWVSSPNAVSSSTRRRRLHGDLRTGAAGNSAARLGTSIHGTK
jgi:protein involved in plasmid replication-relaxation